MTAIDDVLNRGMAAAKANRTEEARSLLLQVVREDESNEQAWLWLASVADNPRQRMSCFRRALACRAGGANPGPGAPGKSTPLRWHQRYGRAFQNLAILFSFAVNLTLVIVLAAMGVVLLFWGPTIKNNVVWPIMDEVMTQIDVLGNATIRTNVGIDDSLPIAFDLPLNKQVQVVLTSDVPLTTHARFVLPGGGGNINGTVSIVIPAGTRLPIHLQTTVPVEQTIPVKMQVPVAINLKDTELKAPIDVFKGLLQPFYDMLK